MTDTALTIERVALDAITPYWRNPRRNERAVAAVKASIEQYGYAQPLVVDADMTIIVGHTRYAALRALGVTDVDVVVRDLTAEEARQYRIADNKTHEFSEWDEDALVAELRTLDEEAMAPFFADGDLDRLLQEAAGLTSAAVTDEAIAGRPQPGSDLAGTAGEEKGDQVGVTCPDCGSEFYVRRADLWR